MEVDAIDQYADADHRQTKHCFQNYVDYYKCINAKGEDFAPCKQFFRAYHALCPNEWKERWDTQREQGYDHRSFKAIRL